MEKTPLKFYNTLTKQVDLFTPKNKNEVTMYSCGPTVYSTAHIGNFRAYVFMDTIRRVLKWNGYKVKTVMNITDVGHLTDDADSGEDKMELAAKKAHKTPLEIAKKYTDAFFEDAKKLNINFDDVQVAKATEHIDDMIAFIKQIEQNGYAYEVDGNVYFDVQKYNAQFHDAYGELSGIHLDNQLAGARIEVNSDKKSPYDFALWIKAPKEHIMKWESPWSVGYPGWHIECSAMSTKYLGDHFDIHTGGIDHVPVHHENEIAQSRGKTCNSTHTQANVWMHCEFLKVDGGKMSKSLNNVYTISDLEQAKEKGLYHTNFSPLDFRYFLLNANFRNTQNFTWEALEAAKISRRNLLEQLLKHKKDKLDDASMMPNGYTVSEYDLIDFSAEVNYDLSLPSALGVLWDLVKLPAQHNVYQTALKMDEVFGLNLKEEVLKLEQEQLKSKAIPEAVLTLAKERFLAKQNKDYAKSDALRLTIKQMGYSIQDTKDGYEVTKD
jgi:cysteinyl-tRNA synthetase